MMYDFPRIIKYSYSSTGAGLVHAAKFVLVLKYMYTRQRITKCRHNGF